MARVLRPGGLLYADIVPRKVSLYRWAALAQHKLAPATVTYLKVLPDTDPQLITSAVKQAG